MAVLAAIGVQLLPSLAKTDVDRLSPGALLFSSFAAAHFFNAEKKRSLDEGTEEVEKRRARPP
jgi:hypothetical protein